MNFGSNIVIVLWGGILVEFDFKWIELNLFFGGLKIIKEFVL